MCPFLFSLEIRNQGCTLDYKLHLIFKRIAVAVGQLLSAPYRHTYRRLRDFQLLPINESDWGSAPRQSRQFGFPKGYFQVDLKIISAGIICKYSFAVDAPGDCRVKGTRNIYSRSARHPIRVSLFNLHINL